MEWLLFKNWWGISYNDKEKFYNDSDYRKLVLLSNKLDNKVLIDIANRF